MARKQITNIFRDGKEYLSLTHAATFCGYHKERLRQLIQENKLAGESISGVWFIEKSVLQNFINAKGGSAHNFFEKPKNSFPEKPEIDSWDKILLGGNSSEEKISFSVPPEVSKSFFAIKPFLGSIVSVLAVSAIGFFILQNPNAAYIKYVELKNSTRNFATQNLGGLKSKILSASQGVQNGLSG